MTSIEDVWLDLMVVEETLRRVRAQIEAWRADEPASHQGTPETFDQCFGLET